MLLAFKLFHISLFKYIISMLCCLFLYWYDYFCLQIKSMHKLCYIFLTVCRMVCKIVKNVKKYKLESYVCIYKIYKTHITHSNYVIPRLILGLLTTHSLNFYVKFCIFLIEFFKIDISKIFFYFSYDVTTSKWLLSILAWTLNLTEIILTQVPGWNELESFWHKSKSLN